MVYARIRARKTATRAISARTMVVRPVVALKATKVTVPSVAASSVPGTPGTTKISAKAASVRTTVRRTATTTTPHVATVIARVVARSRTMAQAPSVAVRTVQAKPTTRKIVAMDQVAVLMAALRTVMP